MIQLKHKNHYRFIIAGIVNNIIGYFIGIILYKFLNKYINSLFIAQINGIISLFITYYVHNKIAYTETIFSLKIFLKSMILYVIIIIYSSYLFSILIDSYNLNIFIVQFVVLLTSSCFTYYFLNRFIYGKKND